MKYEINFYNMNQIIVLVYIEYVLEYTVVLHVGIYLWTYQIRIASQIYKS